MEWASYVAEKKLRNAVSHGNSSGRFLHGPPLKADTLSHFQLLFWDFETTLVKCS